MQQVSVEISVLGVPSCELTSKTVKLKERGSTCLSSGETSQASLQELNIPHVRRRMWRRRWLIVPAIGMSTGAGSPCAAGVHWQPGCFAGTFFHPKRHRAVNLDIFILDKTLKTRQFCTFLYCLKMSLASLTCLCEELWLLYSYWSQWEETEAVARCPVCWIQHARNWEGAAASCRKHRDIFPPLSATNLSFSFLVELGIGSWRKAYAIQITALHSFL